MYGLDTYELVRRSVLVSGMSERAAARAFGLNRRTVAKMVDEPVPAGYQLSKARKKPKLGPFLGRIEVSGLGGVRTITLGNSYERQRVDCVDEPCYLLPVDARAQLRPVGPW